jgi:hypothetical protein
MSDGKLHKLCITCDKMMMANNKSLINIHVYLVDGFKCIPILLNLKKMVNGGTFNNLSNVIFESLMVYEGFIMYEINSKLICFGYDSVVIFIDVHSGVNI